MKQTKSLSNLKQWLKDKEYIGCEAVEARKIGVKPTMDTIKFVKESINLNWKIVGKDYKNKPIYSKYISVSGLED